MNRVVSTRRAVKLTEITASKKNSLKKLVEKTIVRMRMVGR